MFYSMYKRVDEPLINIEKGKTQQEPKAECDINRIMKHYTKYGVVPENIQVKTPKYQDNTGIPTFQEAQNMIRAAEETFLSVPLDIRRACDHNPAKVMDFINDPANADVLKKHGMLKEEEIKRPDPIDLLNTIAQNTTKEPVQA